MVGAPVTWAGVGVESFDGMGNVTLSFAQALDGKITTGSTGAGTYTVNADCTGSESFTSGDAAGETANMVIVGAGTEALAVSTLSTQTVMVDVLDEGSLSTCGQRFQVKTPKRLVALGRGRLIVCLR